ncbi:MAG: squalene--hopene cyclase [Pirellulales bacterium]
MAPSEPRIPPLNVPPEVRPLPEENSWTGPLPAASQPPIVNQPPIDGPPSSTDLSPVGAVVQTAAPTVLRQPVNQPIATPARPQATGYLDDDLPPLATFDDLVHEAPPWLLSAMIHMILLILLGILFVPGKSLQNLILRLDYTEKVGDDLQDDALDMSLSDFPVDQQLLPQQSDLADQPLPDEVSVPIVAIPLGGLDAPTPTPIRMALSGRGKGMQEALLGAYGGTASTQASVTEGLRWLARNQLKDGLWSLVGPFQSGLDRGAENKEAATGMALLAFQGAGITPESNASDPFTKVVRRAWDRFLKQQDEQGNFFRTGRTHARLYTHAIATIALCELYGMTGNSRYREPAQQAINYCVKVQAPLGGWRYFPGEGSDTSVTGWFVMALQSARMAGLDVPSDTLTNIGMFLDAVEREGGRRYAYQAKDAATRSMSAEGLLCRQYLGWSQSDPRLQEGADLLLGYLPTWESGKRNVYYWYYASQVCHHLEGRHWRIWNKAMREVLPANQVRQGRERGSWDQQGDQWGNSGGRLAITCLSIYMLEVYYRHLPIYQLHQLSGQ